MSNSVEINYPVPLKEFDRSKATSNHFLSLGMVYFGDNKPAHAIPLTEYLAYQMGRAHQQASALEAGNEKTDDKSDKEDKLTGVELILFIIKKENIRLFCDQFGETYGVIKNDGSSIMNLDSTLFEQWIFSYIYGSGKSISESSIKTAIKIMKHLAFKEDRLNLSVRVHGLASVVWYDLGSNNFIEIDQQGWRINPSVQPVVFKRYPHQKPQVLPAQGGDIRDFLKLVNIPNEDEQLLLMVYIVTAFIPNFPHAVLMVHGPQGSAKTTACAFIKDLVDPSSMETSGLEDDQNTKELVQTASHHWLLCLDNLSYISEKVSNTISRICTGGGLSKRKLYANDEDYIYNFKHLVVLNGINQVIKKPDLLDRALIIGLDRIPEHRRMTLENLNEQYAGMKPKLLGAIFDAVSGSIREYSNVRLSQLPRMADFAKWGCAAAKAIGYEYEDFLRAYNSNIEIQSEEAIEANPVATTIIKLMEGKHMLKVTPTELYAQLFAIAQELKIERSPSWPQDASALSRRFTELKPSLESVGIYIKRIKGKERKIVIDKVLDNGPDEESQKDATSDILQQVARVFPLASERKDGSDSNDSILF